MAAVKWRRRAWRSLAVSKAKAGISQLKEALPRNEESGSQLAAWRISKSYGHRGGGGGWRRNGEWA
jgi:hypothetical protein